MRKLRTMTACLCLFASALAAAQVPGVAWQRVGVKGHDATYSTNGSYLATISQWDVKIFKTSTWELLQTIGFTQSASVAGADFAGSPLRLFIAFGKSVYSCAADGTDFKFEFTNPGMIQAIDVSEDGSLVTYLSYQGVTQLVAYDRNTNTERFRVTSDGSNDIHLTPDSSKVVLNGPDVYSTTTGARVLDTNFFNGARFELMPDGSAAIGLFGSGIDGKIRSVNLTTGALNFSKTINLTGYNGGAITLAANGSRVLVPLFTGTSVIVEAFKSNTGFYYGGTNVGYASHHYPYLAGSPTNNRVFIGTGESVGVDAIRSDIYTFDSTANQLVYNRHITDMWYAPRHLASAPLSSSAHDSFIFATASNGSGYAPVAEIHNAITGESFNWAPILVSEAAADDYDQRLALDWTGSQLLVNAQKMYETWSLTPSYGQTAFTAASAVFHDDGFFSASCSGDKSRVFEPLGLDSYSVIYNRAVPTSKLIGVDVSGARGYTVAADNRSVMQTEYATGVKKTFTVAGVGGYVRYIQVTSTNRLFVGYEDSATQQGMKVFDLSGATPVLIRNITRATLDPGTGFNHKAWAVDYQGDIVAMSASVWFAPEDPRYLGNFAMFAASNGVQLVSYDNHQVGWGYQKMAFSGDGSILAIARRDPALIGINVPVIVKALELSPDFIEVSGDVTGTVHLTRPAGVGGKKVLLSSNRTALVVPPYVIVPQGATSATFTANYTGVATQTVATVTAKTAPATAKATVTLSP